MAGIKDKVRRFYEAHPYPSQRVSCAHDLVSSGHEKVMRQILSVAGISDSWLQGKRILDGGCGTGEKAIYCALHGAKADAFDFSRTSIRLAKESASKLNAKVNFKVASFESVRLSHNYDLILLIGTLHHTESPKANFLRMAKHLAPGGKIALGLYNVYGRLACRLHRKLLWAGEENPDKIIEKIGAHNEKNGVRLALLADRFASPHETYHSVEEVLQWFSEAGIAPIATHPKTKLTSPISMKLSQFSWLLKSKGFFFVGGRKQALDF
ncbi:MAG: class I SAM-dependent methyltransferase [Candidatus Anstonellaceae archaeon]